MLNHALNNIIETPIVKSYYCFKPLQTRGLTCSSCCPTMAIHLCSYLSSVFQANGIQSSFYYPISFFHFFWMSNQPSFHFPGCLVQILVLLPHIHLPLIFPPLIICSKSTSDYLSTLLPGSNFHSVVKVGGHTYRARTQPHQTLKRGRHAERRIETDMSFNGNRRSPFVFSHWLFQKQNSQFSLFNTERVFAKVISSLYDVHVWW